MSSKSSPYEMAIKEILELKAMTVRITTTLDNVNKDIFEKFVAIYDHVMAKGGVPQEYFTLNHDETFDPDRMDIEVCISVPELVEDGDGVLGRTVSGGTFAFVTHKGPYSGIGDAIAALSAMLEERKLLPCGPMRENYLNDPDEVAPEEILTEVLFPVRE
jgi:effector-binding domain-containing protein